MAAGLKVLITGAQGFIGSRLAPDLRQRGCTVGVPGQQELDLFDFGSISRTLSTQKWDAVIHMAGVSHMPTCEQDPALAYRTNQCGTALLIEGMRRHTPGAHLVFASSAQIYASPRGDEIARGVLFEEDREIDPHNTYARTKWQSELIIQDAAQRGDIKATILRLFNHTHKSQSAEFFLPRLYATMLDARSQGTTQLTIPVGNLDLLRDIGAVDDLVEAIARVSARPPASCETYNVCSGTAKNLRTLANGLAELMGLKAQFETDATLVRPNEAKEIRGSHEKLTRATGWRPRCSNERELLEAFLK